MPHYTWSHRVSFGECDPAGVVYFPRYFEWFHEAMEEWFDVELGVPYAQVLQRFGFPAVRTQAEFRAPCKMGEIVSVELRVGHSTRSSLQLDYRVLGPSGGLRATGATTVVMVGVVSGEADHFLSVTIPEELRQRIDAFAQGLRPA